jgi:acyl carrier protein
MKLPLIDDLNSVFRQVFDDDDININAKMTADDIEDWDSINHITLICGIEEKFEINFSTREIASLDNIGDLIRLIEAKKN